jgi:hypothetical protein
MPGGTPTGADPSGGEPGPLDEQHVVLRLREDASGHAEIWLHAMPWSPEAPNLERTRARLEAIHVTQVGDSLAAEHLLEDRAIPEILRHAFVPIHDHECAERLLCSVESVARSVSVLRISRPAPRRVLPVAWGQRQSAMGYAAPPTA